MAPTPKRLTLPRWPLAIALSLALVSVADGADVARTPPMGFNTWNLYHCSVDAAILNSTAKAIVDSGLAKVGYE